MLIPLKDIELYFDEELVEQAEAMRAEGCVRSIREVEKNFWVAYIEKVDIFETEAVITHQKIKAYTCECAEFKKKHVCIHSICMLLALRENKLVNQLKVPARGVLKKNTPDKDNLKEILNGVRHDELVEFITEYAKKDAKLALLLRSRFISSVGFKDPSITYKSLIESASKSLYLQSSPSNNQTALHLKALILQLFKNAELEVRNGQLAEGAAIIIAIYEELLKLHTKRIFPKLYTSLVHKTLNFLYGIYQQPSSIELKTIIWEHFFPIKITFINHFLCLEEFFTRLMLPLSNELHKEDVLIKFLDSQIELYHNNTDLINQLVVYKMMLAFQMGNDFLFDQMLKDHADSISLLYYAAKRAFENKQWELAGNLLRKTISNGAKGEQIFEIEEMLFQISNAINDLPSIYIYGQKRLMATMDPDYYVVLKDKKCGIDFLRKIIAELEAMPALRARNLCLSKIYFIENELEKLKKLVITLQSLDLLMLYDTKLSITDDELLETYKIFIRQYLHHHIGRQASNRIILVVTHLKGSARLSMAKEILKMLIEEYPERHTLMEELYNLA